MRNADQLKDDEVLTAALRDVEERIAWLEAQTNPRQAARALLGKLIKRRQRVQQRGVPMWEGAQRAALRMVVLAAGCVALITGATALDSTLGGASIVVTLGVLAVEGMR